MAAGARDGRLPRTSVRPVRGLTVKQLEQLELALRASARENAGQQMLFSLVSLAQEHVDAALTGADLPLTQWVMAQEQPLESAQHAVLMSFYDGLGCHATACPRFSSSSNCNGSGLNCIGGKVTRLSLTIVNLTGTIPSTIGQLTALTFLSLSGNQVSGTIPSTIGQLTALTSLSLSNNQLIGTIPSTIGQLTALAHLILSSNQLIGTIPSTIGQLTVLRELGLNNNQLIGTIPSTIGQLTALTRLYVFGNQLIGTIPPLTAPLSLCELQFSTDTNCLDCSMKPSICTCQMRTCSMPTTTTTSTALPTKKTTTTPPSTLTTTPPSTTTTPSSLVPSSIDNTNTHPRSAVAPTTLAITSMSVPTSTTIGANQTMPMQASNSSAITMPAAQSPEDNAALIGGIVGGAVALLLIGALIAFCAVRCRRNGQADIDPNAHALQSKPPSNYGRIDGISGTANNSSTYVDVVVAPPAHYDAWSDPNDYADTGVADRNHYDDFTKIQ